MRDFEKRLLNEYRETKGRMDKLIGFIDNYENSHDMDMHDWNILTVQRDIMISYVSILELRLIKLGLGDSID